MQENSCNSMQARYFTCKVLHLQDILEYLIGRIYQDHVRKFVLDVQDQFAHFLAQYCMILEGSFAYIRTYIHMYGV